MPTEPVSEFLNRDDIKDKSKPVIDILSPLLQEVINYATNVLKNCRSSNEAGKIEAFPLFALYAHTIQMADSVDVLISSGSGTPANLILRSLFEAKLSIKYLLEEDTDRRSIAWLVKYYDDEITYLEMMDPTIPKWQEYSEKYKDDDIYKVSGPPSLPRIPAAIAKLREKIEQPSFAEVYEEYKNRKTKRRPYPEWYSLFDGPSSIKRLAEHFKEGSGYEMQYRLWSRSSHASKPSNAFLIRNPLPIVNVTQTTVSYLLETTKLMINYFLPYQETSFQEWCNREVLPKSLILANMSLKQLAAMGKQFKPSAENI